MNEGGQFGPREESVTTTTLLSRSTSNRIAVFSVSHSIPGPPLSVGKLLLDNDHTRQTRPPRSSSKKNTTALRAHNFVPAKPVNLFMYSQAAIVGKLLLWRKESCKAGWMENYPYELGKAKGKFQRFNCVCSASSLSGDNILEDLD